nr:transposase [Ipomoea batatas]
MHSISQEEWEQSHRYILANDFEIDQYAKEHKAHLKATLRGKVRTEKGLLDEHNRTFINWLRDRVSSINFTSSAQIKVIKCKYYIIILKCYHF